MNNQQEQVSGINQKQLIDSMFKLIQEQEELTKRMTEISEELRAGEKALDAIRKQDYTEGKDFLNKYVRIHFGRLLFINIFMLVKECQILDDRITLKGPSIAHNSLRINPLMSIESADKVTVRYADLYNKDDKERHLSIDIITKEEFDEIQNQAIEQIPNLFN